MLLRKRSNNLFDDFFGDMFEDPFFEQMTPQIMETDVLEKDGQYLLDIELPGYDKKDVQAELKDGYLTIQANKDETIENKDEKSNFVRKERYSGSMKRTFYVGEDVTEEDIQAGFKKPETKQLKDEKKLIPIL